jgi:tetraacyldisaccharide 4'-kinase
VGGTGKTPLVAQIVEWLLARGERPAILSRGYKRRRPDDGVVTVSDGSAILSDLDNAGDEPLMLARQLPRAVVCVAEDRHLAGVVAERVHGATVHVLDDGFQHVQLARDVDVLVTAAGEIANGRVLPRGRLREGREAAARAHFVVVVGADQEMARVEAWELGIGAYSAGTRTSGALGALGALGAPGAGVLAVAGIARPGQFFEMLRDTGHDVKGTIAFGDHHPYTRRDVDAIEAAVRKNNARRVITTAKDAVRMERFAPLPFDVVVAPLRLAIDDWQALTAMLEQAIQRKRMAA